MRIVYMGTPDFALTALKSLYEADANIVAIYTQPPRRKGRGKTVVKSPVHVFGQEHHIEVRHPHKLKDNKEEYDVLLSLKPDIIVVAAYGLILPQDILDIPTFGALNIHASLLPRWRGASPIQQAILAGDKKTGVTIMRMTASLDAGAIYKQKEVPITPVTTATSLHDELAAIGGPLLMDVLKSWPAPIAQNEHDVTYAPQLSRDDGHIDWQKSALEIDRKIRAYTPWPGTFTLTPQDVRIKIGHGKIIHPSGQYGMPGTIIDSQLNVACGQGVLKLEKLQRPSKRMMDSVDFLKGFSLPKDTLLQ